MNHYHTHGKQGHSHSASAPHDHPNGSVTPLVDNPDADLPLVEVDGIALRPSIVRAIRVALIARDIEIHDSTLPARESGSAYNDQCEALRVMCGSQ